MSSRPLSIHPHKQQQSCVDYFTDPECVVYLSEFEVNTIELKVQDCSYSIAMHSLVWSRQIKTLTDVIPLAVQKDVQPQEISAAGAAHGRAGSRAHGLQARLYHDECSPGE